MSAKCSGSRLSIELELNGDVSLVRTYRFRMCHQFIDFRSLLAPQIDLSLYLNNKRVQCAQVQKLVTADLHYGGRASGFVKARVATRNTFSGDFSGSAAVCFSSAVLHLIVALMIRG